MGFSRRQQAKFRPLVAEAWAEHCSSNHVDPKSSSRRAWYEHHLQQATGKDSTTACNAGRDFEKSMAHFEMLAYAGIQWQLALLNGDLGRIRWSVAKVNPDFQVDEPWLRAIAQTITRSSSPPQLQDLTNSQLAHLTAAACHSAKSALKS